MRERKRETLTVLTLLVEALSHMSQSHSITLSPSLSLSLSLSSDPPSINYIPPTKKQTPHHSIAILEKNQN